MAKTVKMCDIDVNIAARVFEMLNPGQVRSFASSKWPSSWCYIQTDTEPRKLIYPEGWYYARGYFTNRRTTTCETHQKIKMMRSDGVSWAKKANYAILIS